jgi:hypothetical protein
MASGSNATRLIPGGHSPQCAPDAEPTIKTGVSAFVVSAMELMEKKAVGTGQKGNRGSVVTPITVRRDR